MPLEYITKLEAEEKTGLKLDGRKRYFIWNNEVCVVQKFTVPCSGCSPDDEYSTAYIGAGCHECGFTGKRRDSFPAPVKHLMRKKSGR